MCDCTTVRGESLPQPQVSTELQLRSLNILHLGFLAQEHLIAHKLVTT